MEYKIEKKKKNCTNNGDIKNHRLTDLPSYIYIYPQNDEHTNDLDRSFDFIITSFRQFTHGSIF